MDVTVSGASRPKGQWVHGAGMFVGEVRNPGPGLRATVAESGSVAPPVLGMRGRAQWFRRRQFASDDIGNANAGGFEVRA